MIQACKIEFEKECAVSVETRQINSNIASPVKCQNTYLALHNILCLCWSPMYKANTVDNTKTQPFLPCVISVN